MSSSETPSNSGADIIDFNAARQERANVIKFPQRQAGRDLGHLATVISITDHLPDEDQAFKDLLRETYKTHLARLSEAEDPNGVLELADTSLGELYDNFPDIDKEYLAALLLQQLNQCHSNITKLAVGHPHILQLIGVGLRIRHPSLSLARNHVLTAVSDMPGTYDFETGEFTPGPPHRPSGA